jgi:hypothetical protein
MYHYDDFTRGADKSLLYKKKQQATGLKKCIYSTYSPLSSTHLRRRCSNFFDPSKNISFCCDANRKIGNRKSQRLISAPTYIAQHPASQYKKRKANKWLCFGLKKAEATTAVNFSLTLHKLSATNLASNK